MKQKNSLEKRQKQKSQVVSAQSAEIGWFQPRKINLKDRIVGQTIYVILKCTRTYSGKIKRKNFGINLDSKIELYIEF